MVRAVTRPTRSPVNGPGPTPTAIRVSRDGVTSGLRQDERRCRGQQLTVAQRVNSRRLGDHTRVARQRDGDGRVAVSRASSTSTSLLRAGSSAGGRRPIARRRAGR